MADDHLGSSSKVEHTNKKEKEKIDLKKKLPEDVPKLSKIQPSNLLRRSKLES